MLALLLTPAAAADCMMPQAFFSVAPSSPGTATAFFFSPAPLEESPRFSATDGDGQPVPFTVEPLTGELGVWQLVLTATPGEITLAAAMPVDSWYHARPVTLTVVSDWTAPGPRALASTEIRSFVWTCDHQATHDLHLTGPPPVAWAVEWAESPAAWQSGERRTAWLPGNTSSFFRGTPATDSRLELGYVSCMGETFRWPGPTIVARVVAVDADGALRPVVDAPIRLDAPDGYSRP
jgi:hypothetical protein